MQMHCSKAQLWTGIQVENVVGYSTENVTENW